MSTKQITMRVIFFLIVVTLGCTDQRRSGTEEVAQLAMTEGDKISLAAQKALGGQLKKAIMDGGPTSAVQFCNKAAYTILDTLNTEFSITIRRPSLRVRNPEDEPSDVERKILENYSNQLSNGNEATPIVEALNDRQVLYAKPIILNNPMCLNCHGQAGTQVSVETQNLIHKLYPKDNAMNHEIGDLRGMWSITFDREELVKALEKK